MAGPPVVPGVQKILNQPGGCFNCIYNEVYYVFCGIFLDLARRFGSHYGCVWWCM